MRTPNAPRVQRSPKSLQVLTGLLLAIRLYCVLLQLSHLSSVQIERMHLTVSRIGVGQCNLV